MKQPAYSRNFAPNKSRHGECVWVFIGSWRAASGLVNQGWQNVLCVPPGSDPLSFDWRILRGLSAVVWIYEPIDAAALAAAMRAAGAGDMSFFDRASGPFVGLALTEESERLQDELDTEFPLLKIEAEAA